MLVASNAGSCGRRPAKILEKPGQLTISPAMVILAFRIPNVAASAIFGLLMQSREASFRTSSLGGVGGGTFGSIAGRGVRARSARTQALRYGRQAAASLRNRSRLIH